MSTLNLKNIQLGDNPDPSKNFVLSVPAVADGTLSIKRQDGTNVLSIGAETVTVLTSDSDIEAQVKTATSATGSAPIYSCRAWVNFNVTGDYGGDWGRCPLVIETRATAPNNTNAAIGFHTPSVSTAAIFKMYGPSSTFECRNYTDTAFVSIAAANFLVSSDYRLKENVVPLGESLPKLKLIKPSSYTWKDTGKSEDGFIAHELQEVVPQAVVGEKDRVLEDGTPVYQGVDASRIMPLVVKSLQELASKVEALEAELAMLKGQ